MTDSKSKVYVRIHNLFLKPPKTARNMLEFYYFTPCLYHSDSVQLIHNQQRKLHVFALIISFIIISSMFLKYFLPGAFVVSSLDEVELSLDDRFEGQVNISAN